MINMSWVNVGRLKGDTGERGSNGENVTISRDTAHGFIYFGSGEDEVFLYLSEIKGAKGDTGATGATGPAGPVNMTSTLDTADTTNAVTNSAIASEFESIQTAIGNITSAQQSNLTLLGS